MLPEKAKTAWAGSGFVWPVVAIMVTSMQLIRAREFCGAFVPSRLEGCGGGGVVGGGWGIVHREGVGVIWSFRFLIGGSLGVVGVDFVIDHR